MNWYQNLYTGKMAKKKKDRILRDLEEGHFHGNTWLITLAANPRNQMDLFSVYQLKFPYIRRNCPLILGIAWGYREALEVMEEIVADVLKITGGVSVREYFETYHTPET